MLEVQEAKPYAGQVPVGDLKCTKCTRDAFNARPHNESKWCRKRASRSPARSASPSQGLGRRPKKTGERRMKRTGDRVRHVSEESVAPTPEDRTPRRRRTSTSRSTRHRKTSRPRRVPRRRRTPTPV